MGVSRQECWSGVPLPSPLLPLALGKSADEAMMKDPQVKGTWVPKLLGHPFSPAAAAAAKLLHHVNGFSWHNKKFCHQPVTN